MENLSIVIITLNEEENIGRCLASLVDVSDDIIVVDSGSVDNTKEICREYAVRFVYHKFDDYSSQKNYGNEIAKHDYVFSIDADECLSEELKKSIIKIDSNFLNEAFTLNRLNHHCGNPIKYGGWYPDKKIRIWNRKYGKWVEKIHEYLKFEEEPKYFHLKGDLLHYTYKTKHEHLKQAEKFSVLNAQSDFEKGRNVGLFKIYFAPIFRFITVFFFKLGFLDGKTGYFIAKTTSHATYLRYKELYKLKCKIILKENVE